MQKKDLQFPVTYPLKIVMINETGENLEAILMTLLEKLEISFSKFTSKRSKTNKYISYTTTITILNREIFNQLYSNLNDTPLVKLAI